jgi:hypothetical protein
VKANLKRKLIHILIFATAFVVETASAWGPVGHKTIATIAEQMLLPKTKQRLNDILQGKSLAQVSIWADTIRQSSQWNFTGPFHYEGVSEGQSYLDSLKALSPNEQKKGGAIVAILESEKTFLDANSNAQEKLDALSFMVHFIGDIHQPLHAGRPEDRGGNDIKLTWNQKATNLHAIWDSQVMAVGHPSIIGSGSSNVPPEVAYAKFLRKQFADLKVEQAKLEDPNEWISESIEVLPDVYKFRNETPNKYTARFIDVQDLRLFLAGLRMANFFNTMVEKETTPASRMNLRSAIEDITGSISSYISIRPR